MRVNRSILNEVQKDADEVLANARKKIRFGSDYIYDDHPIGVPFIAQVRIVADPGCRSMCVNGKELRYNPEFTNKLSVNGVKWVVLHEMMHLVLGHHVRMGNRNHKGWNIAGDLSINYLLVDYAIKLDVYDEIFNKFKCLLPRHGNYAHIPEGESAEYNYRLLEQDALDKLEEDRGGNESGSEGDESQDQGGNGDQDGEQSSQPGDQPGDQGEQGDQQGEGTDTGEGGEDYGSGKSLTEAFDDQLGDQTVVGEVDESPVIDEEGIDVAEEQYEATATQAIVLMKEQGRGAGHGVSMIEDLITKKAVNDWRKLREQFNKICYGGVNYKRPHRRRRVEHSFVPANRSKGKGRAVIPVDTSGSMGLHERDEAFVQMSELLREFPKVEVTMLQVDAVIHEKGIRQFTYNDLPLRIPREWFGNGGTDMQPAVDWVKERKNEFDVVVFITDMEFDYEALTESGVPTYFVGVNANPNIVLPQKSYHYIPVVVEA